MIKAAINNGTVISPEWFRAMQTPSYSRGENEVGHLPSPNGIGGTWMTFSPSSSAIDVDAWAYNALVLPTVWLDALTYAGAYIKSSVMVVCPKWDSAGTATAATFTHESDAAGILTIFRGNILIVVFNSAGTISGSFSLPATSDITNTIGRLFIAGKAQTADPTSSDDCTGGFSGSAANTGGDAGAWWHFSGRGLFLNFLVSGVSKLFKLARSAGGWAISGLYSLEAQAAKLASLEISSSVAANAGTAFSGSSGFSYPLPITLFGKTVTFITMTSALNMASDVLQASKFPVGSYIAVFNDGFALTYDYADPSSPGIPHQTSVSFSGIGIFKVLGAVNGTQIWGDFINIQQTPQK